MTDICEFENWMESAQGRLEQIQKDADQLQPESQEIAAELSTSMEELHVAVEELRLQNEELLVSRLQLEQERQRYQELFDFAPDGYIVTNGEAIIQEVNHSAAQLLNVSQKYLPGKPLDIFVYLPDRDLFNRQWLDITTEFTQACETSSGDFDEFDGNDYATGKLIDNWEIRFQPRQGEPFAIAVSLSATCNAEGHLTKLLWLIRDLRSVKRAEATIQQQATFLDMATDAIWVQDLEGKILYWNQGAEKIYGWKTEEAQQQLGYQLLCDPASRQGRTAYKATAAQGYWRGELQKITKSGQEILVESHWTLGLDSEGIPQYILIVDNDITEKKQLEQQLFQAQRLESLGSLAGGIVHDLSNIFNPIVAVSQLLKIQFSNSEQQTLEMLDILEASGKHGVALVQKILQFIQGVEVDRITMQLSAVIDEIQAIATRTFPESIELRINIQPDLWLICGDFNQLYQVILNLCINARDAMPDGGILKISAYNLFGNQKFAQRYLAAEVKPYVVVTISDTGIGIPKENLDRIFDPFFTTKDRDMGTGLGLSTVLGLVKSHGGFLEVSSKMGQGTQFQVFLPVVDWVDSITSKDEELPTGNGELILVVDDQDVISQTNKNLLKNYGYRVLRANDNRKAIKLYIQHRSEISLVLIDITIPSIDSTTTIYTLREINPQVKIVAVSGLASDHAIAEMTARQVKAFLPKPYTSEELLKTLHSVIHED